MFSSSLIASPPVVAGTQARCNSALISRTGKIARHTVGRKPCRSSSGEAVGRASVDPDPERKSDGGDSSLVESTDPGVQSASEAPTKPTLWRRFRNIFLGGNLDKEKIKALGIGAVLSYGFVSNLSYGICVVIAWITHVKRSGLSPLAPGQWSGFLAVYAGLFALQNFLRPMRFAVAVALTPAVNRLMERLQKSWGVSKGQSFGILMLLLAVVTTSTMALALWSLGGFPPTPPPAD
ncbi:hypothetical protein BSKO_01672 [Bryopsis sp. KO-2023]|nr:hypothetical protein BSKO_01672 [Bryopsis sp. KO-2023]